MDAHHHLSIAPKGQVHRAMGFGFVRVQDAKLQLRETAESASRNLGEPLLERGENLYVVGRDVFSLIACSDRRCTPREAR